MSNEFSCIGRSLRHRMGDDRFRDEREKCTLTSVSLNLSHSRMPDAGGTIYVIQDGHKLVRMQARQYDREEDFQQLLQDFPDLLAGDQINPASPRRWLFISREVAVPDAADASGRWSLDHLFIDQDAVPTMVEVKRQTDSRIRREVVGQMLDYAANAVAYWPGDAMRDQFDRTCEDHGQDPGARLRDFLGEGADPDAFWAAAQANLKAGRARLVFVADLIPRELQRIVEFLNERMSPTEVLAVELRQYAGGGLTTHIPRVIGQTAAAQEVKSPSSAGGRTQYERVELSDAELLAYVDEYGRPGVRDVFAGLIAWTRAHPQLEGWSERKGQTVFKVRLADASRLNLLSAYTPSPGARGPNDGRIHHDGFRTFPFPSEAERAEFFERVSQIPALGWTPEQAIEKASIPTVALTKPGALEYLLDTLSWGLERVTAALAQREDA